MNIEKLVGRMEFRRGDRVARARRRFPRRTPPPWWMTPLFFWLCLFALGVTFLTIYERLPFL